jgi:hypothetical protein
MYPPCHRFEPTLASQSKRTPYKKKQSGLDPKYKRTGRKAKVFSTKESELAETTPPFIPLLSLQIQSWEASLHM